MSRGGSVGTGVGIGVGVGTGVGDAGEEVPDGAGVPSVGAVDTVGLVFPHADRASAIVSARTARRAGALCEIRRCIARSLRSIEARRVTAALVARRCTFSVRRCTFGVRSKARQASLMSSPVIRETGRRPRRAAAA
jgi:hypothetical protein